MPSPHQPQPSGEGQVLKSLIKQMGMRQKQEVGWQPGHWGVLRTWPVGWQQLASRPSLWQLVLEEMVLKFVILEQLWHAVEEIVVIQPLVSIVCAQLWFMSKAVVLWIESSSSHR